MSTRISKVRDYVIEKLSKDSLQDPAHSLDHVLRIYEVGVRIGREENANMEILEPALLLHDIVRPTQKESEEKHAIESVKIARKILPSFGYNEKETDDIAHAILMHSRSSKQEGMKSLEAKIVYDADKQDGVGHAGIARALLLCEKRGYSLEETARWYLGRIVDVVKNEPLYTRTGRKLANEKLKISLEFCRKILGKEYEKILYRELGSLDVSL